MFGSKKKKMTKEEEFELEAATTAVSISSEAFSYSARKAVQQFLEAIYAQDPARLPAGSMEEKFFYASQQTIKTSKKQIQMANCAIEITDFHLSDHRNEAMYAIESMSYSVSYQVTGYYMCLGTWNMFSEKRLGIFKFLNDPRMQYILCKVDDKGIIA